MRSWLGIRVRVGLIWTKVCMYRLCHRMVVGMIVMTGRLVHWFRSMGIGL